MGNADVRAPYVAGQFYEAEPSKLRRGIEALLSSLPEGWGEKAGALTRAVILPHAGYVYSAPTAVKALAYARGRSYKRILLLAPSHRVPFAGLATASSFKIYRTPLGDMPVDAEAVDALLSSGCPYVREIPQAHAHEHSLEVELPLLQEMLPSSPIVPLICGQVDGEAAASLASALLPLWNRDTLWVVSSDFTHYGSSFGYLPFRRNVEEELRKLDLGAVAKIEAIDPEGFSNYVESTGATICGAAPIRVLLETASRSGGRLSAKLADYSNSGSLTGDWSHCVGYAGIALSEGI